jgi:hypothetical protein
VRVRRCARRRCGCLSRPFVGLRRWSKICRRRDRSSSGEEEGGNALLARRTWRCDRTGTKLGSGGEPLGGSRADCCAGRRHGRYVTVMSQRLIVSWEDLRCAVTITILICRE